MQSTNAPQPPAPGCARRAGREQTRAGQPGVRPGCLREARRTCGPGGTRCLPGPPGQALRNGCCLACLPRSPTGRVGSWRVRVLSPRTDEHRLQGHAPTHMVKVRVTGCPTDVEVAPQVATGPLAVAERTLLPYPPSRRVACMALQVWKTASPGGSWVVTEVRGKRPGARHLGRMKGSLPATTALTLL